MGKRTPPTTHAHPGSPCSPRCHAAGPPCGPGGATPPAAARSKKKGCRVTPAGPTCFFFVRSGGLKFPVPNINGQDHSDARGPVSEEHGGFNVGDVRRWLLRNAVVDVMRSGRCAGTPPSGATFAVPAAVARGPVGSEDAEHVHPRDGRVALEGLRFVGGHEVARTLNLLADVLDDLIRHGAGGATHVRRHGGSKSGIRSTEDPVAQKAPICLKGMPARNWARRWYMVTDDNRLPVSPGGPTGVAGANDCDCVPSSGPPSSSTADTGDDRLVVQPPPRDMPMVWCCWYCALRLCS